MTGHSHPTIWKLIIKIRKEVLGVNSAKITLQQLIDEPVSKMSKHTLEKNEMVKQFFSKIRILKALSHFIRKINVL